MNCPGVRLGFRQTWIGLWVRLHSSTLGVKILGFEKDTLIRSMWSQTAWRNGFFPIPRSTPDVIAGLTAFGMMSMSSLGRVLGAVSHEWSRSSPKGSCVLTSPTEWFTNSESWEFATFCGHGHGEETIIKTTDGLSIVLDYSSVDKYVYIFPVGDGMLWRWHANDIKK